MLPAVPFPSAEEKRKKEPPPASAVEVKLQAMEEQPPFWPNEAPPRPEPAPDDPPRSGGSGRFAWHHEALVVPWMEAGKDPPPHSAEAQLDPMREASSRPMLPALIALNPRTTNKDSLKVKGGKVKMGIVFPELVEV